MFEKHWITGKTLMDASPVTPCAAALTFLQGVDLDLEDEQRPLSSEDPTPSKVTEGGAATDSELGSLQAPSQQIWTGSYQHRRSCICCGIQKRKIEQNTMLCAICFRARIGVQIDLENAARHLAKGQCTRCHGRGNNQADPSQTWSATKSHT